jgi:hypothetical protein
MYSLVLRDLNDIWSTTLDISTGINDLGVERTASAMGHMRMLVERRERALGPRGPNTVLDPRLLIQSSDDVGAEASTREGQALELAVDPATPPATPGAGEGRGLLALIIYESVLHWIPTWQPPPPHTLPGTIIATITSTLAIEEILVRATLNMPTRETPSLFLVEVNRRAQLLARREELAREHHLLCEIPIDQQTPEQRARHGTLREENQRLSVELSKWPFFSFSSIVSLEELHAISRFLKCPDSNSQLSWDAADSAVQNECNPFQLLVAFNL